jgi:hypothetical protein
MKYALLTEEDVLKAGLGEDFHLKMTDTVKRVFKGLKKMRFLNRLRLTVNMMRHVRVHYKSYPETVEGFPRWQVKVETLFKQAKSKLKE